MKPNSTHLLVAQRVWFPPISHLQSYINCYRLVDHCDTGFECENWMKLKPFVFINGERGFSFLQYLTFNSLNLNSTR
ncbi:hypothetical protein AQUCO_02200100v1 [Aquilegia coerulea]|uniref:Uncharacterized protein n=1 Tax=Aquilegia coerulea TaxID=218851 RepID=A0A2G5DD43_AQUCA|nr:hypothetical protein AQUCO_02200100v1 [Aquilegia coerulea]